MVGCEPDDDYTTTTIDPDNHGNSADCCYMPLYLLDLSALTLVLNKPFPDWVQLGCDTFYSQYLFSDDKYTWGEARTECESYGGWLVMVGTQAEYNCLLRYGHTQGYSSWFWTDGISYTEDGAQKPQNRIIYHQIHISF